MAKSLKMIYLQFQKWLLITIVVGVIGQATSCPSECQCRNAEAVCRRLPANKIAQIPRTTRNLTLIQTDLQLLSNSTFTSLLTPPVAGNLERLELLQNKIIKIVPNAFDGLSALKLLRVDSNPVICDCSTMELKRKFQNRNARLAILCQKPSHFIGNSDSDDQRVFNCGPTKLQQSDGNNMFVCRPEESLNFDEFETEDDETDNLSLESLDIQNLAANLIGEHECTFEQLPKGFNNEQLKLVVTTDANAFNQVTAETEFKAELIVNYAVIPNTYIDSEMFIHCPQSGKFLCRGERQAKKPKLVNEPYDIDAFEGTTIELPCQGEGEPQPEVQWRKDGRIVVQTAKHRIGVSGSLFIKKITAQEAGRYECTVRNSHGIVSAAALVTVKNKETSSLNEHIIRVAFSEAAEDVDKAINQTMAYLFEPNSKRHHGDLFKIVRYPKGSARELARAAEIYERTLVNIRKRIDGGASLKVNVTDFSYNDILSAEHLDLIAQLSGCMAHRITPNCSRNMCYHMKYRTLDGTCNNLEHANWGASLTGFRRILKPIYENGFSTPIGWERDRLYNGYPKPSARLVSTEIISTKEITQDDQITHMVMQWGQFLDHDLDHAIPSVSSESWDGTDCKKTCENTAPCYPIQVPPNDARVKNRRCIDLFRSSAICGSGMTSILFDTIQPREQINQLTAYIDASQVYGYSADFARDLRNFSTSDGLLRVGVHFTNQKSMLPFASPTDGIDCRRDVEESKMNCFTAGDIRANEQIGLTAMHTIWLREHNRIATELKEINFHWDSDTLYQEARKIVGAQMQVITYEHWLPIILGPEGMDMLGPYKGYNPMVEAAISNEFATAALRFGHTLINPILHRLNETFEPIPQGHLELHRAFFAPWRLVYEGGVDPLMRGMYSVPAKLKKPSQNLNTELTEKLFYNAHAVALDLAAINIQRGRDHGIPGYNEYRTKCNLPKAKTFEDLKNEISDANIRKKLKQLYGHPDNIDLFVGGILEDQVKGGKIGPLFRCILIDQFDRLRHGDRHWYESPSTFRPEQLSQIKMASLGRVLCDNGDNITQITDNVFFLPSRQGGYKSCNKIPRINFNVWLNCDKCSQTDPTTTYRDPIEAHRRQRRSVDLEFFSDFEERLSDVESKYQSEYQAQLDFEKKWSKIHYQNQAKLEELLKRAEDLLKVGLTEHKRSK